MSNRDLPQENELILRKKQVVLLVPVTQEIEYTRVFLEILNSEYKYPERISIALLAGNTIESRSIIWKYFKSKIKYHEYFQLAQDYEESFQKRIDIKVYKHQATSPKKNNFNELKNLEAYYPESPALLKSVRSVLASGFSFTSETNYSIKKFRTIVVELVQDFLVGTILAKRVLLNHNIGSCSFIFLNGRHPSQASIREEIEKQNGEFLTLDWGEPANERMFLAPFQIQEIEKLQNFFLENRATFSKSKTNEAIQFADKWIHKQSSKADFNRYHTSLEISDSLKLKILSKKTALIFTSSADEEIYNLEHNTNGWKSQVQAIIASASILNEHGYQVIVRIHPNASNKSWVDLGKLVSQLKNNLIEYILPWDRVSSYLLIQEVQLVGAWVSRIAVEAAYLGKPCFYLGIGPFSNISGIPLISPANLDQLLTLTTTKPKKELLQLAIYQNLNFGIEVSKFESSGLTLKNKIHTTEIGTRIIFKIKNLIYRILTRIRAPRRKAIGHFGTPTNLALKLRFFAKLIPEKTLLNTYLSIYLKMLGSQ